MKDLVALQPVHRRDRPGLEQIVDACPKSARSRITLWQNISWDRLFRPVGLREEAAFLRVRLQFQQRDDFLGGHPALFTRANSLPQAVFAAATQKNLYTPPPMSTLTSN